MTPQRICADNDATALHAPCAVTPVSPEAFAVLSRSAAVVRLFALVLAVVLPLSAAHCLFMGVPAHGAGKMMHPCCQKAAARAAASNAKHAPQSETKSCCTQLPAGVNASVVTLDAPHASIVTLVSFAALDAPAPALLQRAMEESDDPPGAPPCAAHLLRGPPALA
jgi:hypothetical protein